MQRIRGCEFPRGLLYDVDNNVWLRPQDDGTVLLGMTAYACALAGRMISCLAKRPGRRIERNRPCATLESSLWIGPVRSPLAGELLEVNPEVELNPALVNREPYGRGWIARLRPDPWSAPAAGLLAAEEAADAFERRMARDGFSGA